MNEENRSFLLLTNSNTMREVKMRDHVVIYCFLSTLIVFIGIPANIMSLSYFLSKQEATASKMLFVWLNFVDLFVCMGMVPQSLLNYSFGRLVFLKSITYCSIRSAVYPPSLQMSVILTQMLCLTRTYSLVRPLRSVSKFFLKVCLLVFLSIVTGRIILLFASDSFCIAFSEVRFRCTWLLCNTTDAAKFKIWNYLLSSVMVVPTLFGCVTSIFLLTYRRSLPPSPSSTIKRYANVTVIIITIVCLIGYIQYLVMTFINTLTSGVSIFVENLSLIYAMAGISAINPIIYFIRIQRLRQHVYWNVRSAIRIIGGFRPRTDVGFRPRTDVGFMNC